MQRENHEDAARKRLSKAEEGGLWRNVLASTWTWDFQSPKDDARFWCLRLPVCGLIKATLPGLFPACCLSVCLHSQLGGGQVLRHENMLEEEKDGQSLRLVELERFASCTGCSCAPPDRGRQGGMEMRCWDVMVLLQHCVALDLPCTFTRSLWNMGLAFQVPGAVYLRG